MYKLLKKYENNYRRQKREIEIKQILKYFFEYKSNDSSSKKVLEFGSGEGSQLSYLSSYFDIYATDLYIPERFLKKTGFNNYLVSNIENTPFCDNYFDIIFSNHVLEHLENINKAFNELKRIGHNKTVYIFCVPTNLWLLLSVPAQYFNKAMKILNKNSKKNSNYQQEYNRSESVQGKKVIDYVKIKGHGVERNFKKCFNSFKIDSWKKLFISNGFSVKLIKPILLYSASEFPIIPIIKINSIKFCSSVMFILEKQK